MAKVVKNKNPPDDKKAKEVKEEKPKPVVTNDDSNTLPGYGW